MAEIEQLIFERLKGDAQAYEDMLAIAKEDLGNGIVGAIEWLKRLDVQCGYALGNIELTDDAVQRIYEVHRKTLQCLARYDFDCYIRFVEFGREPKSRFYEPRRKRLKPLVDALQRLEDGETELLALSLPPGVGKTTLAIFYLTWLAGRHPEKPILGGSHSMSFLRGVYDECYRIISGNGGEYLWSEAFPGIGICGTNAKDMRLDIGKPKRFETLEFSSVGSGNAGKVRAETLLYCDDLISGIEVALNKDQLDKLWQQYTTDLRQRKKGDCRELHIATRWSLYDPIGRLKEIYGDSERAEFISVPAIDENGESNFDYRYGVGFSTEFYRQQKDIMDDASWRALYMNEPIEREGQLYAPDELRRYFELPNEVDAIISVVDTKTTGNDYCVMPIAYVVGNDYYIGDVLCDNGKPEIVNQRLIEKIKANKVQMSRFESNSAGGTIATIVQEKVRGICKIQTKYTTGNKETKIVARSQWVKEHCLFLDDSVIRDKEYRLFMTMLMGYTMAGKNKHDDVPDAMAQLAEYSETFGGNNVMVFKRPF